MIRIISILTGLSSMVLLVIVCVDVIQRNEYSTNDSFMLGFSLLIISGIMHSIAKVLNQYEQNNSR